MPRKFNDRIITCPSRGLPGVGVFLLALVTFGLPAALAADALPITGPYGEIEAKGCDDYRQETEGGYIVIDNDGRGYGSGGECPARSSPSRRAARMIMPWWLRANAWTVPRKHGTAN